MRQNAKSRGGADNEGREELPALGESEGRQVAETHAVYTHTHAHVYIYIINTYIASNTKNQGRGAAETHAALVKRQAA
jgi:hypothetical protein